MTEARRRNHVEVKEERERKLVQILELSRQADREENFTNNMETITTTTPTLPQVNASLEFLLLDSGTSFCGS
jgi:hypothetical protein